MLGQPVAYRHVTRDANRVPDDMARRALEARETIIFWDREVPNDATREISYRMSTSNRE